MSVTTAYSSVFTIGANAGHCLVLLGGIAICSKSPAYLLHARPIRMPRTGKDSKETVSFPNLVLIIDERWTELFPALQVHRCVSNLQNTMVGPRNSAQPFRPSLESESLLTHYFPKNDSSAAGVR